MKKTTFSMLTMLLLALSIDAFGGWIITAKNSDGYGDVYYETMLIQDNKLKTTDEDQTTIFNLETNMLTILNHELQTYWEVNMNEIREKYKKAIHEFVDEALKAVPPEQREMYRPLFAQMEEAYADVDMDKVKALNIDIKHTGKTQQIAGFKADEYQIIVNGQLKETKWIAKDLDISDDMDVTKMMDAMMSLAQFGDDEFLYMHSRDYINLHKKGFEMKSLDFEGETREVTRVEQRRIDAADFRIPDGYRKITLQEMMMMEFNSDDDSDW